MTACVGWGEYPNPTVPAGTAFPSCAWRTTHPAYPPRETTAPGLRFRPTGQRGLDLCAPGNGVADRDYPWGSNWDPAEEPWRANTYESNLGRSTAVGLYPHGASPVGALDMAGNVWEWCLYPFEYEDPDDLAMDNVDAQRVLRGGSWLGSQVGCRAAVRGGYGPNDRNRDFGFRLCLSSSIEADHEGTVH